MATITKDVCDCEVWRIKGLAPLHEHPVQHLTIFCLGSTVGWTVAARQTAIGNDALHQHPILYPNALLALAKHVGWAKTLKRGAIPAANR